MAVGFNSLIYMVVSKNWGIPKTDGVYPHLFWTPPLLTKLMGYQRSITGHHRTLFFFLGVDVAVYKVSNMDKEAKKHVPKKCRRDIWRKHGLIETSLVILYR